MNRLICLIGTALVVTTPLFAAKMYRPVTHTIVAKEQGPKIKVLLAQDVASALIEAKGAYRVVNKADGVILSSGSLGKRYVLHALQQGLRWGEEYPDVYELIIKPINEESSLFVNGIQYKGALSVYHSSGNKISVVNEVPIEHFLTSILSVKYEVPLAKEAMAAVAIIERTAIYKEMEKNRNRATFFDYTKEEVKYQGYGVTRQCAGVDEIVEATRFMVLEGQTIEKGPISLGQFEELAHKGFDAKQILSSCYPKSMIGLTTPIPSKIIR